MIEKGDYIVYVDESGVLNTVQKPHKNR